VLLERSTDQPRYSPLTASAVYTRSISLSSPQITGLQGPVHLEVDQQLSEGPRLRVSPELTDPIGAVEVGETQDVYEPEDRKTLRPPEIGRGRDGTRLWASGQDPGYRHPLPGGSSFGTSCTAGIPSVRPRAVRPLTRFDGWIARPRVPPRGDAAREGASARASQVVRP
jgi:hypothetical protein